MIDWQIYFVLLWIQYGKGKESNRSPLQTHASGILVIDGGVLDQQDIEYIHSIT